MSGSTYPRFGEAPATGEAVGAGLNSVVHENAAADAEEKTKIAISAIPAIAATATMTPR